MTMEEKILEQIEAAKEVQAISFVALAESGQIDDETINRHKDMFKDWDPLTSYKVGQIRKRDGVLYRISQEHSSQEDHLPNKTPSLYERIGHGSGRHHKEREVENV